MRTFATVQGVASLTAHVATRTCVCACVCFLRGLAGLVKGASEGAGLGNDFLSNIQAMDGLYHVVRAFDNDDIIHVEDSVDPVRACVRVCVRAL